MSTVKIVPDTLEFKTPLTSESTDYIEINNESDEAVAFKVKTTAPKLYCVRPTAGKINAGESTKIEIIFLGLAEEPEKDSKCKDKFLVLTLPAPYDLDGKSVSELWTSLEAEFKKNMISKKIKVKYVEGPAQSQEQQLQEDEPIHATSTQEQLQKEEIPTPVIEEVKPIVAPVPVPVPAAVPVPVAAPVTETKPVIPKQETVIEKNTPISASSSEKASTPVTNYDAPLAKEQPADSTTSNSNILLLIAIVIFLLAWLYY